MSQSVETTSREQDLARQLAVIRQQLEFTMTQLSDSKERQQNAKKINQSLMKALVQEKPDQSLLHEIKLIVEDNSRPEREKSLMAEIQKLRRQRDRQVEQRVQRIIKEGEFKSNTKCKRCEELLEINARLEAEIKKNTIIIIQLRGEKESLADQALKATNQTAALERVRADLEEELSRTRQKYETELVKMKEFKRKQQDYMEASKINRIQSEYREKIAELEANRQNDIQSISHQLDEHYRQQYNELANKLEEDYQYALSQMEIKRKQIRLDMEQDKRTSRVTPTKPLRNENNINIENKMQNEIRNLVAGLSQAKTSNNSVYSTGNSGYSQYCNFTIRDSLNRPNTHLQSHLRLKR